MEKRKDFKISIESDRLSEEESNAILRQIAILGLKTKLSTQVLKDKENGVYYLRGSLYIPRETALPEVGSWVRFIGSKNKLLQINSSLYDNDLRPYYYSSPDIQEADNTIFQVVENCEYNGSKYVEVIQALYEERRKRSFDGYSDFAIPLDNIQNCNALNLSKFGVWIPSVGDKVILQKATKSFNRNAPSAKGNILAINIDLYQAKVMWWRKSKWTYDKKNCDGIDWFNFIYLRPE